MKTGALMLYLVIMVASSCFSAETPRPDVAQLRWQQHELIMFVCLDPCTWQGREYDDHSLPVSRIHPRKLDTDQWCATASLWGAKEILFVAKHTGGFCWWQTSTSTYGVKETPWRNGRGDVLADLSLSCKKFGLDLGVYVYPGDETWGAGIGSGGKTSDPSKQEAYNRVFRQQLTEVLSNYGTIREVWFDGSCVIDVHDILKRYAADAVIFQGPSATIRWVGNEDGIAPDPNWYTVRQSDLATGVATAQQSNPDGDAYAPVEVDVPLLQKGGHKWFWAPNTDSLLLDLHQLMDIYDKSVGRGSVLLLNSTPDTNGVIPDSHVEVYRKFGEEIKRRYSTPLRRTSGAGKQMEMAFSKEQWIDHIILQENLENGQRVLSYVVEGYTDGQWKTLCEGTSIGNKKIDAFNPVEVEKVRVRFLKFKAPPEISNFAACEVIPSPDGGAMPLPTKAQLRWHNYERIMFVHFSANTWQTHRGLENEYDDLSTPLSRINPSKLNTDQWCEVARSWGAKMILFVAKHGGGFCSWQTNTTDYGIRNTAWRNGKGDILGDLSKSCEKYGLDLGVYLYPGDPHWGAGGGSGGITADSTKQEAYSKIYREQLTEILTRYGEIREVWFDGNCKIYVDDILKKYASNAVIFQGPMASLRWVGTEDGYAPFSNWYTLNSKDLKTGVATSVQSDPFGDAYAPVEVDVPLLKNGGHKWFWAPNSDRLIMSTEQLMNLYYKSVGRGSVLLLNSTPDTTGLIPASHAAAYKAFGDEIRRRFKEPLKQTSGRGNVLDLAFSQPTEVNHVVLQEDLAKGQRVLAFKVEAMDSRGQWKAVYEGTSVGFKRICYFEPIQAKKIRVMFTNVKARPQIANFAAYFVRGIKPEPDKRDDRDKFYDGVGNKQGTVGGQEASIEVGTWKMGDNGTAWTEFTFDLTKQVRKIGQYEIAFETRPGKNADGLEFADWEMEIYGGKMKDVIEMLPGGSAFRVTRSQQTLDDFPTIFRVKMKNNRGSSSGIITIKRLTY
jgi:alpha-L-fucosidase